MCATWVPRLLTPDQNRDRKDVSAQCLAKFNYNSQDFLRRFVTVDETWIYRYTRESKEQSKALPGESAPKKANTVLSAGKVMAMVFWDSQGIILIDYLEKGKLSHERTIRHYSTV